jgi:hypothetical protein
MHDVNFVDEYPVLTASHARPIVGLVWRVTGADLLVARGRQRIHERSAGSSVRPRERVLFASDVLRIG